MATFEHVLDLTGALSICLDRLQPDGVLLFELPLVSTDGTKRDWLDSSYEHIYYPTESGIRRLLELQADLHYCLFQADIRGFNPTIIAVATRNAVLFDRVRHLVAAMTQDGLDGLGDTEMQLNLAFQVVYRFDPTPARILALPELFKVATAPNLLKRLTQLWYADAAAVERLTQLRHTDAAAVEVYRSSLCERVLERARAILRRIRILARV